MVFTFRGNYIPPLIWLGWYLYVQETSSETLYRWIRAVLAWWQTGKAVYSDQSPLLFDRIGCRRQKKEKCSLYLMTDTWISMFFYFFYFTVQWITLGCHDHHRYWEDNQSFLPACPYHEKRLSPDWFYPSLNQICSSMGYHISKRGTLAPHYC